MRKDSGITLIALIITIILLLILATVTVDVAMDGKLFDKAQEAVDKTNDKVAQQQNRVDELTEKLEEIDKPKFTLYIGENRGTELVAGEYIGTFYFEEGDTWADFIGNETGTIEGVENSEYTGVLYDDVIFEIGYAGKQVGIIHKNNAGEWNYYNFVIYNDTVNDIDDYIVDGAEYIVYSQEM